MKNSVVSSLPLVGAIFNKTYLFQYPQLKVPENTPEGFKLIAHNNHIVSLLALLFPTLIFVIFLFPWAVKLVEFILMFSSRSKEFFIGNISASDLTILKWEACIFATIIIFILSGLTQRHYI